MKSRLIWDYSQIPERRWKWFFVEDHWMEVVLGESGLEYIGTDWTCQSGGGYSGGFQTYDGFLNRHPLQKMPRKITKEVRDYIKEHRVEGGSTLQFYYVHEIDGLQLSEVFVNLDDKPILIKKVQKKGKMTIYNGSIKTGIHQFSFVFVLRSDSAMKKIDGKVSVKVQEGANSVVLKTTKNDKGKIVTEVVQGLVDNK